MARFGDRGELRLVDPADADAFTALSRGYAPRPRTNEWLSAEPGPAGVSAFLESALARRLERRGFWCGVWWDGALAGAAGLEIEGPGVARLDYLLGPAFRGQGLMTAALDALVAHAFGAAGLHRLEIQPDADNAASRAVAERLGFRLEGVLRERLRHPGGHADQAVYGLLRAEWEARATGSARPAAQAPQP